MQKTGFHEISSGPIILTISQNSIEILNHSMDISGI